MVSLDSFKYALRGVKVVLSSERNARIHLVFAILAIAAGIVLQISLYQASLVVLAIVLVFFAEIVNSAIEKTLDITNTESNQMVKLVKDMTAAGVLVTAVGAVLVGILVFGPRVWQLIFK
ncbi:diacylglycerol kinase family protein [Candidatus Saccharibacteria bacterium]|nr:diacylglycerol kinase family protein [Candidatus Saccharibacteria bacterium]